MPEVERSLEAAEEGERGWDGLLEVRRSSRRHLEERGCTEHDGGGRPSPERTTTAAAILACCACYGGAGELEGDGAEVLEAGVV